MLYTGKGGVGKTTVSAATAACASARGSRTLVASADAAHSLGDVLGLRLGPEPTAVAPGLDALEVDVRHETERHFGSIRDYLISLFRHQGIEEIVADELALLPGAEELTTLLAVRHWAAEGGYDLVVVDCAPTDAALRLLTLPEIARSALRVLLRVQRAAASVVTPLARNLVPIPLPDASVFRDAEQLLYRRLRELRAELVDARTTTRLVVTHERMVIDEAVRAHTDLALFSLHCDAVVMNRILPQAALAEPFFAEWGSVQQERRAEIGERFAPLPVLESPLADDEVVGLDALRAHGDVVFGSRDPSAILCDARPLAFERTEAGYQASIPLPHAQADALDVAKLDDQLLLATGTRRRAVPLPRHLARLDLLGARLTDGRLVVQLGGEVTP